MAIKKMKKLRKTSFEFISFVRELLRFSNPVCTEVLPTLGWRPLTAKWELATETSLLKESDRIQV